MPTQLSNFKGMKGTVFSNMRKEVCVPPPNSDVEALTPNLLVLGDRPFGSN